MWTLSFDLQIIHRTLNTCTLGILLVKPIFYPSGKTGYKRHPYFPEIIRFSSRGKFHFSCSFKWNMSSLNHPAWEGRFGFFPCRAEHRAPEIMQIRAQSKHVNQSSCRHFTSVKSRIYIWIYFWLIWLFVKRTPWTTLNFTSICRRQGDESCTCSKISFQASFKSCPHCAFNMPIDWGVQRTNQFINSLLLDVNSFPALCFYLHWLIM